ncbi:MAG: transposase [Chlamydiales bacterium]
MRQEIIQKLQNFRTSLHRLFTKRADALFNLLDALSRDGHQFKSVVELSQSVSFERSYNSITDGITRGLSHTDFKKTEQLVFDHTRAEKGKPHLFFTDCTANPRPFAKVMQQRGIVHSPNPAPGNKPICVGHQYSLLAMSPKGERSKNGRWLIPMSMKRVALNEKGNETGVHQVVEMIKELGIEDELCINTGDSLYGSEGCRKEAVSQENLVQMFRLSNKRKLYQTPEYDKVQRPGRRKLFGDKVILSNPSTHPKPDAVETVSMTTKKGKTYQVELTFFKNLLIRGSKDFASQEHPLNVVKAVVTDDCGVAVFKRPLWIALIGKRKDEVSPKMAYDTYLNRYDIEHFFRFGKQKLLLDSYQTPEVTHEEDWWRFVPLAYVQLYLANQLSDLLPKPWERYLPNYKNPDEKSGLEKTPSQTQRAFANILEVIGTPAAPSVPRGRPTGRVTGTVIDKREPQTIHFKSLLPPTASKKSDSSSSANVDKKPNTNDIDRILSRLKFDLKNLGLSQNEFIERLISSG